MFIDEIIDSATLDEENYLIKEKLLCKLKKF